MAINSDGSLKTFLVPDLGEGLEEVTLVTWEVRAGDTVELNQQLCVVETAKAEVEIPSPYDGLVVECVGEVGDTLAVGSPLIRIDTDPTESTTPDASPLVDDSTTVNVGDAAGKGALPISVPEDQVPPADVSDDNSAAGAEEVRTPQQRTPVLVGYGIDAEIDISRRGTRAATEVPSPESAEEPSERPRAKPAARLLARSLDMNLSEVTEGSGVGGAITRSDVQNAAAGGTGIGIRGHDKSETTAPVAGIRARIAERMAQSRREIPDAHASVVVDCTELLATRARLQKQAATIKLSPFALILRLLVIVLGRNRTLNARWQLDEGKPSILTHSSIHLGFGAATARGLVVPVLKNAERFTTLELAQEVQRLIEGARDGTLHPRELTGSTFTVSNFGALGLDDGVPVINYPEAAILGLGAISDHVVADNGSPQIRAMMRITCAFDHRIGDGADVAALLVGLRDLIENPGLVLLHL